MSPSIEKSREQPYLPNFEEILDASDLGEFLEKACARFEGMKPEAFEKIKHSMATFVTIDSRSGLPTIDFSKKQQIDHFMGLFKDDMAAGSAVQLSPERGDFVPPAVSGLHRMPRHNFRQRVLQVVAGILGAGALYGASAQPAEAKQPDSYIMASMNVGDEGRFGFDPEIMREIASRIAPQVINKLKQNPFFEQFQNMLCQTSPADQEAFYDKRNAERLQRYRDSGNSPEPTWKDTAQSAGKETFDGAKGVSGEILQIFSFGAATVIILLLVGSLGSGAKNALEQFAGDISIEQIVEGLMIASLGGLALLKHYQHPHGWPWGEFDTGLSLIYTAAGIGHLIRGVVGASEEGKISQLMAFGGVAGLWYFMRFLGFVAKI